MLKSRLLLGLIFIGCAFAACEKPEAYNEQSQYDIDEALIKKWSDSSKVVLTKHESGIYYNIIKEGTGTEGVTLDDTLKVQYEGKLLTDSVFSQTTAETDTFRFVLKTVMPGWQKGLPLVKEGGEIRLLIPSKLGYRNYPVKYGELPRQQVPANSVLNFKIDLKKVVKKK
ncbi:FKBP-type peptidyl-prolyl cis-trans isomerase [Pedobacter frigoris]|uniref:FKBP-type peptidyl-prolyl cis-trans isomerase n=1 Tax=Pedobacter frigoris TaxID=2571272 RepID=UPI00292E0BC2|nr:FKBP-type peptidyl-prolyl cis-trans isomerase [Pedobacter frigoris]